MNQKQEATIRLSLKPLVASLLFIALFAGFQGGRYIFSNRLQELGIFCALLIFAVCAWSSVIRIDQKLWKTWVYTPVILCGFIMLTWAAVFAFRFNESFIYCAFASREFMLLFIAPAIFLAYKSGFEARHIETVVWACLICLMLNYLYFQSTMDLMDTFFSSDHTVSNLVTYDEWRGFRLKPPLFAIMLGILASLWMLTHTSGLSNKLLAIIIVALGAYIWSIVLFRSTLATMLLSIALYPILFARKNRLGLFLLAALAGIAMLPIAMPVVLEYFTGAEGGGIRLKSFQLALSYIPQYPFLGVGEDNSYGKTYQDLFAFYFYPSDLGFIGVLFKYGLIGASLYIFMHIKIWSGLLQIIWRYKEAPARDVPSLIWALFIFFTAQTFNLILNPGLAFAPGITAGALAIALCAVYNAELQNDISQNTPLD